MLLGLRCKCGRRLKVPESRIGKTGTCPACRSALRLVAPSFHPDTGGCDALIEIIAGPNRVGEVVLLAGDGPIEIGKLPDKHLVLASPKVSRGHCRLVRGDRGWRIEDQRSTNGLYVNGKRIEHRDLRNRDVLLVGDYQL